MDVKAFFDSVPWDLMLKAVARHTTQRWVMLYVERWLKAPMLRPDGTLADRTKGRVPALSRDALSVMVWLFQIPSAAKASLWCGAGAQLDASHRR